MKNLFRENKLLCTALITSLVIHLVLVISLSISRSKRSSKPLKSIDIVYQKIKSIEDPQRKEVRKNLKVLKEKASRSKVDILTKDNNEFSPIHENIKNVSKVSEQFRIKNKSSPKISTSDMTRSVSVPLLKSDKIDNPQYLDYNSRIRQKIENQAYFYVDHPEFQTGSVYVTFLLSSNGKLMKIQIREDRTFANDYLKEIALKTVEDAAPFSKFPEGLNYPEFTFNIMIDFKKDN